MARISADGIKRPDRKATLRSVPKENTRLRLLFDLFQAHKGSSIDLRGFARQHVIPYNDVAACIATLSETYELDIRRSEATGYFILAGYWNKDDEYVPYALCDRA